MGMTIDDAINHIKYGIIENNYPLQRDLGIEACNLAIDTMRKYQKIEEIYDNWNVDFGVETHRAMSKIGEVLKDEKID